MPKKKVKAVPISQFTAEELQEEIKRRKDAAFQEHYARSKTVMDFIRKHYDVLYALAELMRDTKGCGTLTEIRDGKLAPEDVEFYSLIASRKLTLS